MKNWVVFRAFKNEEGWAKTVNRMAEIDAPNIRPFEVKQMIHFLVNQQERRKKEQPGEVAQEIGKTLLQQQCTMCHDLERVIAASKTQSEWDETVDRMIENMGDPEFLSASDKKDLVSYLTRVYFQITRIG